MAKATCVQDCLDAKNPLKREVVQFLIEYREEDDRLDYKSSFVMDEQHWLELVKDLSAFANTHGGYLLFGVDDATNELIGIERGLARALKDANAIQQKINRNLEPALSTIRAKEYRFDGKSVVAVHVPRSRGVTHLVSKDGEFKYPSGAKKTILRKGTFYVRRSAGNHLGDSRDLDSLIERRIEQFQDALKDKIATVIDAPSNSEVIIATGGDGDSNSTRFVLSDSEDALPVAGLTFTKSPKTPEEEIMAWRALSLEKSDMLPAPGRVWTWYKQRNSLTLDIKMKQALFKLSLWQGAPAFFWIKDLKSSDIREALLDSARERPNNSHVTDMLEAAAYLGKKTYQEVLSLLGSYRKRIAQRHKEYPSGGPSSFRTQARKPPKISALTFQKECEAKLSEIANSKGQEPKVSERWNAQQLDIFLYARDDQYK